MNITRRNALLLTAAATTTSFTFSTSAHSAEGDVYNVESLMNPKGWVDRAILGAESASVTTIEYSSPTCPHCANFHMQTFPEFTKQLIETGKTRFILRPFARNLADAVVFMLADAGGEEKYHEIISAYFATQNEWARSDNLRDALLKVALQLGFTEESFEKALTNQELFAGMEAVRDQASSEFNLTGTPSFYVNGKMLEGNKSLDQMSAEINSQQA